MRVHEVGVHRVTKLSPHLGDCGTSWVQNIHNLQTLPDQAAFRVAARLYHSYQRPRLGGYERRRTIWHMNATSAHTNKIDSHETYKLTPGKQGVRDELPRTDGARFFRHSETPQVYSQNTRQRKGLQEC